MSSSQERIKTGISGFDKLLSGGFVKNSVSLLLGTPGTGKTIFSLAFLYNGVTKFNETGVYVTFEQPAQELEEQAMQFGWNLKKLQKKKKLHIVYIPVEGVHKETLGMVTELVKKYNAKRLVIDSLSTLSIAAPYYTDLKNSRLNPHIIKYFIYKFVDELRLLKCTSLLINELRQKDWLGEDTTAEFVVDTIILLRYFGAKGASSRTIAIKKARKTKFDENIYPFSFTKNGIKIGKLQKVAMPKF